MKKHNRNLTGILLPAAAGLAGLLWFAAAVSGLSRGSGAEGRELLERAVRRAAVACYAAEGAYPPTLEYLTEEYGIRIGEEYVVFYEVFASNLMPDITVLEKDMP